MFRSLFFSLFICGSAISAEPVEVLLITSPELEESWKPYAKWRTQTGYRTAIRTTESIDQSIKGDFDIQEKIRQTVQSYIRAHKTKSVILGGDSLPGGKGHVPDRDTFHQTRWGKNEDIPTDIYYLSPTNWDADGDGIYGEWEDDKDAITYPDGSVGLGRIPVRSIEDVKAYTDKVIAYESNYPKGTFATTMGYLCTEPHAEPKLLTSQKNHLSKTWKSGEIYQYYTRNTPWDEPEKPGSHALSADNVVDLINKKTTGKLHIHGHGLLHCWQFEHHTAFTSEHVSKLTNKNHYPVVTTVSCFTGQYDAPKDPCIAESMLRVPDAGAVIVVSPCREGKPHFVNFREEFPLMMKEGKLDGTTYTMTRFWENGLTKGLDAGKSFMATKAELAEKAELSPSFHMCLCEINLLGDPTLSLKPE